MTCETCPHYLVLTEEDADVLGVVAKCAPPLRPAAERDALWSALGSGDLPMIASDHSPSPAALKDTDNAFEAWGGIAGAQTLLTLTLDEGAHRATCRSSRSSPRSRASRRGASRSRARARSRSATTRTSRSCARALPGR